MGLSSVISPVKNVLTGSSSSSTTTTLTASKSATAVGSGIVRGIGDFRTGFRAFGTLDTSEFDPAISGYTYVFMTAPAMNVSTTYIDFLQQNPTFVPIITSLARGFPESDFAGSSTTSWENYVGHSVVYGHGLEMETDVEFTIEYNETQELLITKIHRDWLAYIYDVKMGKRARATALFKQNMIDYAVSFYVFNTMADGRTINYWSKYTGVFPVGIGASALRMDDRSQHDVVYMPITYKASIREALRTSVLQDFNEMTSNSGSISGIGDASAVGSRNTNSGVNQSKFLYTDNGLHVRSFASVKIGVSAKGHFQLIFG